MASSEKPAIVEDKRNAAEKAMIPRNDTIRICRRAIMVALVIGTILNLINQAEAIFAPRNVDVAKLLLTYLVPFFVSAHGAFSFGARVTAPADVNDAGGVST